MARIRTIKPEFPQSESMGRVSRESRLCFILLWTLSDDEGRLRGNSRMLASLLYPYDDDAKKVIDKWLFELGSEGCITQYGIGDDHYIQINNWTLHQKIDHPSKSKIPAPIETSRNLSNVIEDSLNVALDQGKDQGKDQGAFTDSFELFWKAYPKKRAKPTAEKAFKSAKINGNLPDVLKDIESRMDSAEWKKDEGQFIPYPATYLNQRRWEDGGMAESSSSIFAGAV